MKSTINLKVVILKFIRMLSKSLNSRLIKKNIANNFLFYELVYGDQAIYMLQIWAFQIDLKL